MYHLRTRELVEWSLLKLLDLRFVSQLFLPAGCRWRHQWFLMFFFVRIFYHYQLKLFCSPGRGRPNPWVGHRRWCWKSVQTFCDGKSFNTFLVLLFVIVIIKMSWNYHTITKHNGNYQAAFFCPRRPPGCLRLVPPKVVWAGWKSGWFPILVSIVPKYWEESEGSLCLWSLGTFNS